MTIFERLAYSQPAVLLALARAGLMTIDDHVPGGIAQLMNRASYRRVRGRLRQVRCA